MKRTTILGLLTLFSIGIFAQNNAIDRYFKAHLDNPAFTKFEVTEKSFELFTDIETEDAEEQRVLDALSEIEGIKVLANRKTDIGGEYYLEAMGKLDSDGNYEDLVVLETASENVRFLIREDEMAIKEFVAVISADENFVIASLYGKIDLGSISRIMEVMRNGGGTWFNIFENMHEEEIIVNQAPTATKNGASTTLSEVSINDLSLNIFPNPATEFIFVEAKNGVSTEMEIGFYSLLGKEIRNYGKATLPYKVELKDLPAGTYFLRLTDKAGSFKNFKIVNK